MIRPVWSVVEGCIPDDGNYLLKHVGANLECINKSYYYLDAFVGYFTTILQNARSNYQE
jgi:hypothetical protein